MEPLVRIEGVTKKFGGVTALDNVSAVVEKKTATALIGPNGSGKSTLLSIMMGFTRQDEGEVYFGERRLGRTKPHQRSNMGIGMTFQLTKLFRNLTVSENLLASSRPLNQGTREKANQLMEFFDIAHLKNELASRISYGQRKLLELARALMLEPEILLLDEPTAGINPNLIHKMSSHISDLRRDGVTFLIVEHNLDLVKSLCDSVIVLDHGVVIAKGLPEEALARKHVIESYLGG